VGRFQKTVSRKGAKEERKGMKVDYSLRAFLCAFAGDGFLLQAHEAGSKIER
jgi:hypothetical protein